MVKAFHDQGIKVYIDVVYNHTGEGGAWNGNDPTTYNIFSWRGLDNPTYYELTSDLQYSYDNTGVGGNYNTYNPVAQNLIVDSLAYWRDTMGVDGFRFDLGSVLGNTCTVGCFNFSSTRQQYGDQPHPARAAAASGRRRQRALTFTPSLGRSAAIPTSWAAFRRAGRNGTAAIATRCARRRTIWAWPPSPPASWRRASPVPPICSAAAVPWNSTNFMVVHDGFTLNDLYSCNGPNNNQAWPYGPSDGGNYDELQLGPGRRRRRPARRRARGLRLHDAERRHAVDDGRGRIPAQSPVQQQCLQRGLGRQLAQLQLEQRPNQFQRLCAGHDRLPQGPRRAASREFLLERAVGLVDAGGRARRTRRTSMAPTTTRWRTN